jgi:hypothetical protein
MDHNCPQVSHSFVVPPSSRQCLFCKLSYSRSFLVSLQLCAMTRDFPDGVYATHQPNPGIRKNLSTTVWDSLYSSFMQIQSIFFCLLGRLDCLSFLWAGRLQPHPRLGGIIIPFVESIAPTPSWRPTSYMSFLRLHSSFPLGHSLNNFMSSGPFGAIVL